jgi:hypothetical protein
MMRLSYNHRRGGAGWRGSPARLDRRRRRHRSTSLAKLVRRLMCQYRSAQPVLCRIGRDMPSARHPIV